MKFAMFVVCFSEVMFMQIWKHANGVRRRAYLKKSGAPRFSLKPPRPSILQVLDDETSCAAKLTPQQIDNSGFEFCPVR
jgi:hypothetical protein